MFCQSVCKRISVRGPERRLLVSKNKMLGIALLIVGVLVLVWANNMSSSLSSQIGQTFSGSMSAKEILAYVVGVGLVVFGILKIK